MKFNVLTLFPEMFDNFVNTSIIGRAIEDRKVNINIYNIRDYSENKHNKVDDYPYGGGPGMVMTPQPLDDCISDIKNENSKVVYLTPKGKRMNQNIVNDLTKEDNLLLICGHYEGIDQRIIDKYVDLELSIGDFVLTGGELPAMVLMDSMIRTIPGVLGDDESFKEDSHYNGLLEYPQYTRPQEYDGMEVPQVLLSGNHKKIDDWRLEQSIIKTISKRPDLIQKIMDDKSFDQEIKEKILEHLKK